MAEVVLTNGFISVDGTDLSDHGIEIGLDFGRVIKEKTAFSESVNNFIAGLKVQRVLLRFNQDFAASSVESVLNGADDGAVIVLTIRPDAGVVSTSNPQWSGNMLQENYAWTGRINEIVTVEASYVPGDGTGLARTTS